MSEESILQAVLDEKLFGVLEVDMEVPDVLKSKFAEMPPIFKNIDVSRDDIGDHMKAYAGKGDHEPEEEVSDWKYAWRKDHLC